jgi:hypothetical protein
LRQGPQTQILVQLEEYHQRCSQTRKSQDRLRFHFSPRVDRTVASTPTGRRPHVFPKIEWSMSKKCSPFIVVLVSIGDGNFGNVPRRARNPYYRPSPHKYVFCSCGACVEGTTYELSDPIGQPNHRGGSPHIARQGIKNTVR